ncbi:MAG TPA: hypothetical protein VK957_07610 [Lunatimonas sp.]|nr:hypothetical protein [Lunatimonas sp.]
MSVSIYLVSIFLGLAGGLFYALKINKDQEYSNTQRLILGLIIFVTCFELYAIILVNSGRHNLFVYNICFFYLETFILLGYLYAIHQSKRVRQTIFNFSVVYLIWGIINTLLIQDIWITSHNYSFLIASLGILTFCLLYIFGIAKNNKYFERPLWSIPHFWNTSILLIFYSTGFLYFLSLNFLHELDPKLVNILGSINRSVAGTMYIVLGFSYYAPLLQTAEYAK